MTYWALRLKPWPRTSSPDTSIHHFVEQIDRSTVTWHKYTWNRIQNDTFHPRLPLKDILQRIVHTMGINISMQSKQNHPVRCCIVMLFWCGCSNQMNVNFQPLNHIYSDLAADGQTTPHFTHSSETVRLLGNIDHITLWYQETALIKMTATARNWLEDNGWINEG